MRNRKLNAMTQYFAKCYFPWVTMEDWQQIKQKVLKYFNEEIAPVLPMPDGTIDFVVYPDKIMVIEVNVYGEMAGTCTPKKKKERLA
ncbi:hypothetical protein HW132_35420 [Brasilonema sp. CT11]|nr:hypothetical protein [Brasilonema sp. CT11]